MKLHTFQLMLSVSQSHDDAIRRFRRDRQFARQRFPLHDQRMITRCRKRLRQLPENPLVVMMDFAGLPMKQFRRPNDFPSKGSTQRLVSQANSKNRKSSRQPLNQFNRNPCFQRRARPRRNHDSLRFASSDFFDGNLVVAMHFHFAAQLSQILGQVVGKRIVVVEQQNHCFTFISLLIVRGFERTEQGLGLIHRLVVFADGSRIGDNPSARLNMRYTIFDDHRTQRDTRIEVAGKI
jgi:hypothetical protein